MNLCVLIAFIFHQMVVFIKDLYQSLIWLMNVEHVKFYNFLCMFLYNFLSKLIKVMV